MQINWKEKYVEKENDCKVHWNTGGKILKMQKDEIKSMFVCGAHFISLNVLLSSCTIRQQKSSIVNIHMKCIKKENKNEHNSQQLKFFLNDSRNIFYCTRTLPYKAKKTPSKSINKNLLEKFSYCAVKCVNDVTGNVMGFWCEFNWFLGVRKGG